MTTHTLSRMFSIFGAVALFGLQAGSQTHEAVRAEVRPAQAVQAPAVDPEAAWRQGFDASVPRGAEALPALEAATPAEMQLALAGAVGRAAHLGRGVVMEDTLCDEATGGAACGQRFLRAVAADDEALATSLAPAVARLGDGVRALRVTAWTVEGDGVTARGVSVQGIRGGRVVGLRVAR